MLRHQVPSTNSLFTFEIVARLGSFSAAAKELNVTQPAISRAISSLENHLGYALFHRHGRWIELTQNGDRLFRATSSAFNGISELLREIGHQSESRDVVTISMSTSAANHWFLPRISQFRANFPAVQLIFLTNNTDTDELIKEADLWIRLSNPEDANMHRWPFADERILTVCTREYLAEFGTLDRPVKERLHTVLEVTQQRFNIEDYLHATGRAPLKSYSTFRFSEFSSSLQATLAGHGISVAWISEIAPQIISGQLVPACTQVVNTGRRYHILASNLTPMRAVVEDIRDWLIQEMRSDQDQVNAALRAHMINISPKA